MTPNATLLPRARQKMVAVGYDADGREVPIYGLAYYERVTTKQAGKEQIREARTLLQRDPLAGAGVNSAL